MRGEDADGDGRRSEVLECVAEVRREAPAPRCLPRSDGRSRCRSRRTRGSRWPRRRSPGGAPAVAAGRARSRPPSSSRRPRSAAEQGRDRRERARGAEHGAPFAPTSLERRHEPDRGAERDERPLGPSTAPNESVPSAARATPARGEASVASRRSRRAARARRRPGAAAGPPRTAPAPAAGSPITRYQGGDVSRARRAGPRAGAPGRGRARGRAPRRQRGGRPDRRADAPPACRYARASRDEGCSDTRAADVNARSARGVPRTPPRS